MYFCYCLSVVLSFRFKRRIFNMELKTAAFRSYHLGSLRRSSRTHLFAPHCTLSYAHPQKALPSARLQRESRVEKYCKSFITWRYSHDTDVWSRYSSMSQRSVCSSALISQQPFPREWNLMTLINLILWCQHELDIFLVCTLFQQLLLLLLLLL